MDEIVALPSITLPITLVCAGNRRKEENMLKKSIGFNWGPCATRYAPHVQGPTRATSPFITYPSTHIICADSCPPPDHPPLISTTYWTGVRLRDLLLHAGIQVR